MSKHRARKRFGQNFLQDPGIIDRIVRSIAPKAAQHLVEIGPGQAALTIPIADSGCKLDVIELDRDLVPLLEQRFVDKPKISIHQADALNFDFTELYTGEQNLRVVGNLPYNISTPLIFHLLSQRSVIKDMHFMLQKEVVDRLAAESGSKAWGRLGIMTQYYCEVQSLFEVPPEAFTPRPKVQSSIVRLVPHKTLPHPVEDEKRFAKLVQQAFQQRRKTLRNNLKGIVNDDDFEQLEIDPSRRPETLSLQEFTAIANQLSTKA